MLTIAQFTIVKIQNKRRYSIRENCGNKIQSIYTIGLFSAVKKKLCYLQKNGLNQEKIILIKRIKPVSENKCHIFSHSQFLDILILRDKLVYLCLFIFHFSFHILFLILPIYPSLNHVFFFYNYFTHTHTCMRAHTHHI